MRVLAVDDEKHALNTLISCLNDVQPDAEVHSFLYSTDALDFVKNGGAIDVAFLDINMPTLGGIELAKELKKIFPSLNVIFCTAYSEYMSDAIRMHASGYVTKPYSQADIKRELDNLLHPIVETMPEVFIRTFGDFDVFVDGIAVTFSRAKCKEMLAYLVWKRGGVANKKEIGAVIFGDDYTLKTQNYFVHVCSDLLKTLKSYNLEKILIKGRNQYAVDTNLFSCDLYDFDAGKPNAINTYKGEFMSQYEWGMLY